MQTALTKNEIFQEDLTKACELLGRYIMSNDMLKEFMGPSNSKITISTEIIDNPDAVDNKAVKQKVLKVVCTRYTKNDTPENFVNVYVIDKYDASTKYGYLSQ